ncbi:methyltransferase domain-containing protein [Arcobacter cryaerophilus gv. pseudocryaerophilus]|uniref:Methyltransferase domain-containing protein n=3 Tax=unclassified Arcobacter TaxID=2593671 RepID=A0AA96DW72_9BACT|nr:methyltransferase domain-containing protein [Arcobacter sp. AZ-2023]WPD06036.1 methyltransferase domain-containing protein [Arcobacter sp. DSM 115956]WPD08128.1 methyltransferase domain-containing protein [Arcobacter sp. DSM 115955]WNL32393.1 methyltransferase domain-containing protein [Arcobacter sp. AZ-2023]WNP38543.1 methyltransferase domain-containing protein [Arcobacter sp. AZ-2023]
MIKCPICENQAILFDSLDFNKSCEEVNGKYLKYSGILVDYHLCSHCYFCFAQKFEQWTKKDFEEKIYNKEYTFVDPEYNDIRPKRNAKLLLNLLKEFEPNINHLDYGGGNGKLSQILNKNNIRSKTYDPYSTKNKYVSEKFELITAFEVFEHVNDVDLLFHNLINLLSSDGCIIFSTALNDDHLCNNNNLSTWWYAAPRNGHISLFSRKSLNILANKYNLEFQSINHLGIHILYKSIPLWFGNIDKKAEQNYNFSKKINIFNNYLLNLTRKYNSIALYGFGVTAKIITSLYPDKIKLIVDNDVNKQNIKIKNIEVKDPQELRKINYDLIIITVLGREDEINNFLIKDIKVDNKYINHFKMSYILNSEENYVFAKELNSFYNYLDSLLFNKTNVLLYGFSIVAKIIIALHTNKIKFVLDSNTKILNTKFHNVGIAYVDSIKDLTYDLLLVTVLGREQMISNSLINTYNVHPETIESLNIGNTSDVSHKELTLRLLKHKSKMDINYLIYPYRITPNVKKLHLIFFMGIGDYIYTTPLWAEIKKKFPKIKLIAYVSKNMDLINNPLVYDLLRKNPLFSEVYYFDGKPGNSWEEYDFSDVKQYLNTNNSSNLVCPVIFKHTDVNSTHRVNEIFNAFSLECDLNTRTLPLLYILKNDYNKSSEITKFINSQDKEVIFIHLETRSTTYNYKDDFELIQRLIDMNYYVVYIKKDVNFNFNKSDFYNLNITTFNLFESIAFIDSIKIRKYFIATNSLMTPISSALNIPMLSLFILKDSTQTRLVFYKNMRVVTVDKNCYDFLPKDYSLLVPIQNVEIINGNLISYKIQTIVESFLHFFK